MSGNLRLLVRSVQAEVGCNYTTARNAVLRKLAELRPLGISLKESHERIAVMTPEELGFDGTRLKRAKEIKKEEKT